MMETMWTFETARFRATWAIEPDDDCDLSFDETGETADNIRSGLWRCFTSRVMIELDGQEIGTDYLGGSIYANPEEFRDHIGINVKSRRDGKNYGSYFSDMVRQAIAEAREEMKRERPKMRA